MPTYEYQCDACGHRFEKFQSMSAAPIRKCPSCGKVKVRRLLGTGAGIIFKGSGFYITDYRDKSYTEKAKAESGAKSESNGSGDKSTSESKPAASTESKPATSAESKPAPKPESKPKKKSKD